MLSSFEVTARDDQKTQKDLDRFVSDLYTKAWEPDLPVWRAFVINDLEDGRHAAWLLLRLQMFGARGGFPANQHQSNCSSGFKKHNL